MNTATPATDTIVESITIDAPVERVFDAFIEPAARMQWWSVPGRFHVTHADSDLRPGGGWSMRGTRADGQPFLVRGEYREVFRPTLLVFTWLPDWQGDTTESLVRIELTERDGVTDLRLTHSGLVTEPSRTSHRGWPQILGLLKAHVEAR
jgi:uncharacterized protein YndB with AHSA1/START domain